MRSISKDQERIIASREKRSGSSPGGGVGVGAGLELGRGWELAWRWGTGAEMLLSRDQCTCLLPCITQRLSLRAQWSPGSLIQKHVVTLKSPETSHCSWPFPLLGGPASSLELGIATHQPSDIASAYEGPSQSLAYLILTAPR